MRHLAKIYRSTFNPETYTFEDSQEFDGKAREITSSGIRPARTFQLLVPCPDPDTGEDTDCDGDMAYAYLEITGAEVLVFERGLKIMGFVGVSDEVDFYHRLMGEYGPGDRLSFEGLYRMEQWHVKW